MKNFGFVQTALDHDSSSPGSGDNGELAWGRPFAGELGVSTGSQDTLFRLAVQRESGRIAVFASRIEFLAFPWHRSRIKCQVPSERQGASRRF
jgi:hypothetical protein